MQIYIHRDNEEFGPYSREVALEYVKQGVFGILDSACYAGMSEWKTLGELLGIALTESKPKRKAARPRPWAHRSGHITEFDPTGMPEEHYSSWQRGGGGRRTLLILINVALILIVAGVAFIRVGSGGRAVRHGLLALSTELARLANSPLLGPAPTPAASPPAPAQTTAPTAVPSLAPLAAPTVAPAAIPTATPRATPSASPTPAPTVAPTVAPTAAPSAAPTATPTPAATVAPTPTPAPEATQTPVASATPAQSVAPVQAATPAPEEPAAASPAPAPAAPTPPPAPTPFDPAELAGNPAAWPRSVRLREAVTFPAVYDGQVVGSFTAPAGTAVRLLKIQGNQLTVSFQGGTRVLDWRLTDLEAEVAKPVAAPAPPAAAPTATPAPSNPGLQAPADTSTEPSSDN